MNRADKIEHAFKAFANYQAKFVDLGGIQILDWLNPKIEWSRVRYIFDREGGRIYISGDLGEAVVRPTWRATLDHTCASVCYCYEEMSSDDHNVNEAYFLERVLTTSNRYAYDRADAESEIRDRCPQIEEWDLEAVMSNFDDEWGLTHLDYQGHKILYHSSPTYKNWIPFAGRSIHGRVYLWLVGLKMAWVTLRTSAEKNTATAAKTAK